MNIKHLNKNQEDCFMLASKTQRKNVLHKLLQINKNFLQYKTQDKKNALIYACIEGKLHNIKYLLRQYQQSNIQDYDIQGRCLIVAVQKNYLKIVGQLLKYKTNINYQDKAGMTAINWSSRLNNLKMVKYLANKGADINIQDISKQNTLTNSIQLKNFQIVKFLTRQKINLTLQYAKQQNIFHYASVSSNEILKYLLNKIHQNINHQDDNQNTPLILACQQGLFQNVYTILQYNPNVYLENKNGDNVLSWACFLGNTQLVKILLPYYEKSDRLINQLQITRIQKNQEDIINQILQYLNNQFVKKIRAIFLSIIKVKVQCLFFIVFVLQYLQIALFSLMIFSICKYKANKIYWTYLRKSSKIQDCGYCKNLIQVLPQSYQQAKQEFQLEFTLYYFNCTKDGFCKNNFETSGYPDFRYYPVAKDPKSKFIKMKNSSSYKIADVVLFMKTRLQGISFQLDIDKLQETLSMMNKNLIQNQNKILLFCKKNLSEQQLQLVKKVVRIQEDILAFSLTQCDSDFIVKEQYLQTIKNKIKKNTFQVAIFKPENFEINFFNEQFTSAGLYQFVKTYKKELIYPLNDVFLQRIMSRKQPAMILFLNNEDKKILNNLENFSLEIIKEKNIIIGIHINNTNQNEEYNSNYLKQLLGLKNKDLPALRIIHKINDNTKKYKYQGNFSQFQILKFYQEFVDQKLQSYNKNDLEVDNITQNFHSIISEFDQNLLTSQFQYDKHYFVLILGDEDSQDTQNYQKDFEEIILKNLKKDQQFLEQNISFQFASIFRENLDDYVHNQVPVLMYFQQNQQNNKPSVYFWNISHFKQMIQLIKKDKDIRNYKKFMDISGFITDEL